MDDLFGLRVFNVDVVFSVSKPPARKRKINKACNMFKESYFWPDYGSI